MADSAPPFDPKMPNSATLDTVVDNAPAFDPNAPSQELANAPAFDPNAPSTDVGGGASQKWSDVAPGVLSQIEGMVTDIPHQISRAASSAYDAINRNLNPFSDAYRQDQDAYLKEVANAPLWDITPQIRNLKRTGAGLAAIPEAAFSPITGTGRSVLGHGFEALDAMMPAVSPENQAKLKAAGVQPRTGEEFADAAMMAVRPRIGLVPAGSPPVPPAEGPFGVTLSQGEASGTLPQRVREMDFLRQGSDHAQQWNEQRAAQLTEAPQRAAVELDPYNQSVAANPQQAADIIHAELDNQQAARTQKINQGEQALTGARESFRQSLSPTNSVLVGNPLDAADIVSGSVAQAAENAQAATDAAYARFRELPGAFHPASFNKVGQEITTKLAAGEDPTFINPQTTPQAARAVDDLQNILGDISQTRDPETGRIIPKPPLTPQIVETARKRLNSFYGDALNAARTNNNWGDVRAMRQVMGAFDDQVLKKLGTTFTGGDPRDVSSALNWARAQHAQFRKTFTPQGAGDTVGRNIQSILGRYEGQAATPEEITKMLYGTGGNQPKVAERLINIFGADSPEAGAVRQGLLSHILERPPGAEAWDWGKVANRIDAYTKGPGRTLVQKYLTPEQVNWLQRFGVAARQHAANIEASENPFEGVDFNQVFRRTVNQDQKAVSILNDAYRRVDPASPQATALRLGPFLRAIQPVEGVQKWGPKQIGDNLASLLASTRNSPLYSPAHRQVIQSYIDLMRRIQIPAGIYSPSGPAINRLASLVANRTGQLIGAIIGRHLTPGVPILGEFAGITIGGKLERLGEAAVANRVKGALPLVADQMAAYQKALNAYNKRITPLSKAAVGTAAANLSRSLHPLGIELSNIPQLQLPGVGGAQEPNQSVPGRADGGPLDLDPSLPGLQHTAEGLPYIQGDPNGLDTPTSGLQDAAGTAADPNPTQLAPTSNSATNEAPTLPLTGTEGGPSLDYDPSVSTDTGNKGLNRLLGVDGEERYQTWPERMVRSGATLAGDVLSGREPDYTGLRREDFTDTPAPVGWTVAVQPSDAMIERAQDMAGLAGIGGMPIAEEGAVGMVGGKLPQLNTSSIVKVYNEALPSIKSQYNRFASENSSYLEVTPKEATEMFGDREDWPEPLRSILDQHGKAVEISTPTNVEYLSPTEAPSHTQHQQNAVENAGGLLPAADLDDIMKGLATRTEGAEKAASNAFSELANQLGWKINGYPGRRYFTVSKKLKDGETSPYDESAEPGDDVQLKVRVSDHPNLTRSPFAPDNATTPDINLAPGAHDFNDAADILSKAIIRSDTSKPAAALSALEHQPPFYSVVEDAIADAPQQKMHASQWLGWLKNQPGVKAEELEHLGLTDPSTMPSTGKGLVTRDDLLRHVKDNGMPLFSDTAKPGAALSSNETYPDQHKIPGPIGQQPHANEPQQRASGGRVNPNNINHTPTEAQKRSGTYAKDHVSIQGLNITIENAKGSIRRGVDKDGTPWEVVMPCHYGYIRRSPRQK